ncbi:hypothetical protein TNCV_3706461 [Trichonephila clavipes]|nr:hypothetical protein TNCV_3706461 [Trichonephila clavipes]
MKRRQSQSSKWGDVTQVLRFDFQTTVKQALDLFLNDLGYPDQETKVLTYNPQLNSLQPSLEGCGSPVVTVSDYGKHIMSSTKYPPCRASMHVKSIESLNVLSLVW